MKLGRTKCLFLLLYSLTCRPQCVSKVVLKSSLLCLTGVGFLNIVYEVVEVEKVKT